MLKRHRKPQRESSLESLESRSLLSLLTVTSAQDGRPGSLRDVIDQSQAGDVIRFAPGLKGATLSQTGGEIAISKSLTIVGSGQILSGNNSARLLQVGSKASLALSNLTLTAGLAGLDSEIGYVGGAIEAKGASLSLNNCRLVGNHAVGNGGESGESSVYKTGGGALFAEDSTVVFTNCLVKENSAIGGANNASQGANIGDGGGLLLLNSSLIISGGQFVGNVAHGGNADHPTNDSRAGGSDGHGGALAFVAAPGLSTDLSLIVSGATFLNNQAIGGDGLDASGAKGAEPAAGPGGKAQGGALFVSGTGFDQTPVKISITGDRFQNNRATGGTAGSRTDESKKSVPSGGEAQGGAIKIFYNNALELRSSTFKGNVATGGTARANPVGQGKYVGWGGEAYGGAVSAAGSESATLSSLNVVGNQAIGGKGSDSPADGSSYSGAGGWAYGGGIYVMNDHGGEESSDGSTHWGGSWKVPSAPQETFVLPIAIDRSVFSGNSALGGQLGAGTLFAEHAGGGAQGGGLDMMGIFDLILANTDFRQNAAVAGEATTASGGGLGIAFGNAQDKILIVNSEFVSNRAYSGANASNPAYRRAEGGAFLDNAGNTTIVRSLFQNNAAIGGADTGSGFAGSGLGGAIFTVGQEPHLTINASCFTTNLAQGGQVSGSGAEGAEGAFNGQAYGGALYTTNGTLIVNGGRFTGNVADGSRLGLNRVAEGGAIYSAAISPGESNYSTDTQLYGVWFGNNQAIAHGDSIGAGGAVANFGNTLTDRLSTYQGNRAASEGLAYGGSILVSTSTVGDDTITPVAVLNNEYFNGNRAQGLRKSSKGYGGAIAYLQNPKAVLTQPAFQRNKATTAGNDVWGEHT